MKNEVKLYLITKFIDALYNGKTDKIKELLMELLHTKEIDPAYWDVWMNRYKTLIQSRDVQVSMLRSAGFTYKKIQDVLGVSPNTVQRIMMKYEIDYTELPATALIEDNLARLEARLKKGGVALW